MSIVDDRGGYDRIRAIQIVNKARRRLRSHGLGQGVEVLFGKSQSYYSKLDAVQNRVIGIMAEMAEIGEEAWDNALWSNLSDVANAGWMPVENYLWSPMMGWWKENYKKITRTPSYEPSEDAINEVNRLAAGTDNLIAFVKRYLPASVAAAATAYRKEAVDKVANYGLISPGDVARETVIKEIEKKIGGGISTILVLAGAVAVAAVGAYALLGRKR